MASPGNQHCANCIGTLSFPIHVSAICQDVFFFPFHISISTIFCFCRVNQSIDSVSDVISHGHDAISDVMCAADYR